ncbi:MAG: hypothetical protein LBU34_01860 [Planctomycetaceae bacterium]|nr:hypothetical protein [Planctomycetaceae bacterium]
MIFGSRTVMLLLYLICRFTASRLQRRNTSINKAAVAEVFSLTIAAS